MLMTHRWKLSRHTTPSGKVLMYCPVCKLYDPAPVKPEYERRPCEPDLYKDNFYFEGKVVKGRYIA